MAAATKHFQKFKELKEKREKNNTKIENDGKPKNMIYLSRLVVRIEPGDPAQDSDGFLCPVFLLQDLGLPAQQIQLTYLQATYF